MLDYGKVPPNAIDVEKVVLGACMLQAGTYETVSETLSPEAFYTDAHQRIFRAMSVLSKSHIPIDLITVSQQLQKAGEVELIGGLYYLTSLTRDVVSGAHTEAHAKFLQEKYLKREVIRAGLEMVAMGYNETEDVFDVLEKAEGEVLSISNNLSRNDFHHISESLVEVVKLAEEAKERDNHITGVPTGFQPIDKLLMGWQKQNLIILAARPSVGKTAMALNLARNAAKNNIKPVPVAIFSLEMSTTELTQKMASTESGLHLERIRKGLLHDPNIAKQFREGIDRLSKIPLFLDDTAALNLFEFRSKARRLVSKFGVGLIIVDYLQLMSDGDSSRNKNREQEVSNISRGLKKVAKELNVPIIALSQLSRDVEKRGKGQKVPQLSDLRESGAIEQDADIVIFLYRPPLDEVKENPELKGTGLVRIAKNRSGVLEDIPMKFDGAIQQWLTADEVNAMDNKEALQKWKPINTPQAQLFDGPTKNATPTDELNEDEIPF